MYRALIICNSVFPEDPASLPVLHGPRKDGLLLWRALTDADRGLFNDAQVEVIHESSSYEARGAIEEYFSAATAEDILLLYYSGHGRRYGKELVLCFRDTKAAKLQSTGISCSTIKSMVEVSHARAVIVILDCCHGAAFKGEPVVNELTGEGIYVISAAGAADVAGDAERGGQPSPFTKILAEALVEAEAVDARILTLDALYETICRRTTVKLARPWKNFDGAGVLEIARMKPLRVKMSQANNYQLSNADAFDRLIANLSQPTPKFGAEQRLIEMDGAELFSGCLRVLNEIFPGEKDHHAIKDKESRLVDRLRSILIARMPESGDALAAQIDYLISDNKFREASRLVRFVDTNLMTPKLLSLYKDTIESGRYADIAGQILEDVVVKYRVYPGEWRLTSLNVADGAWGYEVLFEGINFSGSTFNKAGIYGSKFVNCNLQAVQFTGCSFHNAIFDGSDLREAGFLAGTGWRDHVSMTGSKLQGCNLEGSVFENVYTFYESGSRGRATVQVPKPADRLSFVGSNVSKTSFKNCDLRGADFSGCQGIDEVITWSGTRLHGSIGLSRSLLKAAASRGAVYDS